jgi:GTP-sensing pleiotropic transcriptional regulator CodY
MLDRPSKNFRFIFAADPELFTIDCATSEVQKLLNEIGTFNWFLEHEDYVQLYQLGKLNPFDTHDINCDLYLIQRREQILKYNRKTPIKTRSYKKVQKMLLRNQIINEDVNCNLFKNTRVITFNKAHELYADEFDKICQI